MEKLDPPISREYQSLVIWLEDLNRIVAELKDNCSTVFINTETFKFNSVEEFLAETKCKTLSNLRIECNNPYIVLEFRPYMCRFYVGSSDTTASGIFHKINSLIESCERRPRIIYSLKINIIFFIYCIIISIPNLSYIFRLSKGINFWITPLLLVLGFYFVARASFINMRRHSVINLFHRTEQKSFLEENRNAILVAIVGAIAGAIIGAVTTRIANDFWPSSPTASSGVPLQAGDRK